MNHDKPACEEEPKVELAHIVKPSPREVAEKAYFIYLNSGSPQGCDLQHWIAAERELMLEKARTRFHGVHN